MANEPLLLTFGADTSKANNAIAELAGHVTSNMLRVGTALKNASQETSNFSRLMAALPTEVKLAAGAFVAFESAKFIFHEVSKSIDEAKEKLRELVAIGQGATAAGVGTDFFQRWTSHAGELNTTAEKLAATLENARKASEVTIGIGEEGKSPLSLIQDRLEEHRKTGNVGQGDIDTFNSAQNLEDKIKVMLDLIEKLNREMKGAAAVDIGRTFFGDDFASKLREGTDAVGLMRKDLEATSKVNFSPELIARAKELNTELERAKNELSTAASTIKNDFTAAQIEVLKYTKDWYGFLTRILNWADDFYARIKDIAAKFDEISGSATFSEMARIANAYNNVIQSVGQAGANVGYALGLRGLPEHFQSPEYQLAQADAQAGERTLSVKVPTGGAGDRSRNLLGRGGGSSSDEVDTYIKQLQKSVDVLEAENRTYGLSNTAKAEAVDLEKALAAARSRGTPLTEKEIETVKRLADAEGAAKDRATELRFATEQANARANFFGEQLLSVFDKIGQHGTKARDIFLDIAKAIEKAALQALILGSGPFAGLFGTAGKDGNTGGLAGLLFGGGKSLFGSFGGFGGGYGASSYAAAAAAAPIGAYGPGFAGGGMVGSGGGHYFIPASALATARHFDSGGAVPALLHPGEVVLNAAQQANVAGKMRGSQSINLTHAPTINGTGLSAEQVFSVVQRSQKDFARQIGPILNDWQRRYQR